jgi:hypothetical protein
MRAFLILLGVGFAVTNATLWFSAPAIRDAVDASYGRLDAPGRPNIIFGVQELLVYFDPFLARIVFPIIFTAGFALIPFLGQSSDPETSEPTIDRAYLVVASGFLLFLEAIWLVLIGVGIWCRGPNWNFYWPSERWDPWRIETLNYINLSELFWLLLFPTSDKLGWLTRESPGLLLIGIYFLFGAALILVARWKQRGFWRILTATWILQLALLIPLKMACRFLFNLQYFIWLPEFGLNI